MNARDDQAAHLRVLADVVERVRSGKRLRLPPAVSSSVLDDQVLSGLCLSGGHRGGRLSGPAVELTAVTLRIRIAQTSVRTPQRAVARQTNWLATAAAGRCNSDRADCYS